MKGPLPRKDYLSDPTDAAATNDRCRKYLRSGGSTNTFKHVNVFAWTMKHDGTVTVFLTGRDFEIQCNAVTAGQDTI